MLVKWNLFLLAMLTVGVQGENLGWGKGLSLLESSKKNGYRSLS